MFGAEDATLGARFAVKRLRDDAPWPPERSAAREIAVLSRCRHPNIVRLFGYTSEPTARCLLFELGDAGALSGALADGARAAALTWHARVRVAAGVAAALNYLHRASPTPAWHRDVKADNIVLTAALEPKLIDCGVSKLLTLEEAAAGRPIAPSSSFAFGTPAYMCATYMRTQAYDARSEVYSFGVVLCELVTGILQMRESAAGAGDELDLVEQVAEAEGGLAARRDARPPAWAPLPGVEAAAAGADVVGQVEARAQRCVARRPEARPPLADVAAALAALRAAHCAPAAEAAALAGQLGAVAAQRDALLAQAAAAQAARGPPQQCVLKCSDEAFPLSDGVACAAGHFCCAGCLAQGVNARGDAPASRLCCWGDGERPCGAEHTDHSLVLCLPPQAAVLYLSQVQRAERAAMETAVYATFKTEVKAEAAALAAKTSLAAARRRVVDEVLTLACPGCKLAMPDHGEPNEHGVRTLPWAGCFAVKCAGAHGALGGCGTTFCGWCWRAFGTGPRNSQDCHVHVGYCQLNAAPGRDLYGGPRAVELFAAALRTRRQRQLAQLLATLPAEMHAPLLQSLARELADAGLVTEAPAAAERDAMEVEQPQAEEMVRVLRTAIVGAQHHAGVYDVGDVVALVREPLNPFDASAVRVDAAPARGGAPLGHLPRVVAAALAALLDEAGDGAPRVEARIPRAPRPGYPSSPLELVRARSAARMCARALRAWLTWRSVPPVRVCARGALPARGRGAELAPGRARAAAAR